MYKNRSEYKIGRGYILSDEDYIAKLSDYMRYIEELPRDFSLSRGQYHPFPLLPSALRRDNVGNRIHSKRSVNFYIDEFKANSYHYMPRPWDINGDLEWMIYGQHYGIPTRLLDFTSSHIVSLMFAVENAFQESSNKDAVVWFINPIELNNKFAKYSDIINIAKDNNGALDSCDGPVALQGRKLNTRINAQNGLFVYFQDDDDPLEMIVNEQILKKVLIKKEDKKGILASLYTMGIGFSHIYPELDYVARDIIMKKSIADYLREEL